MESLRRHLRATVLARTFATRSRYSAAMSRAHTVQPSDAEFVAFRDISDVPDPWQAVVKRCRRRVARSALLGAGVSLVPVPGLDIATDVALLARLIPEISREFGLSNEQIERLAPERRIVVYKAISAGGSMLLGRMVTQEVVLQVLRMVGVRLSAQQAAKYLPVAGQAVSAVITYAALRYVCEQHIRQCCEVARQLALPAPTT